METTIKKIEALGASKLIGVHPAGSLDWLVMRSNSIGGSDIAALMNKSPFKSKYTLWAEKQGLVGPTETNLAMRMGQLFEPAIAQLFKEQHPELFVECPLNWTFESTANPKYHANPDGLITDKNGEMYILEIKHTRNYWSELPEYYRFQVLWYMYVLGLKNPAIVCAVTGGDYREFQVEWDETLMGEILEAVEGFLGLLKTGSAPAMDGSVSTYESVREISPDLRDADVDLGNHYIDLMAAKIIAEEAESNLNKHKSIVLSIMNGAKYGQFLGERVITLQSRNNKPFITFKKES